MDYDVEAVALAIPPAAASITTYRPAITVRNNGTHPAIATGNLQAYMAGLLVWSSTVESGTLAPGATGLASALTEWKPEVQGDYILFGYVTTERDQVEPNNNLAPVKIHVGPEPPVPPPTVPNHVEQHESGGPDELFVEGLQGQLADDQPTLPHAAKHQAGGEDQLNVAGLSGVLGEAQPPQDHNNSAHTVHFASSVELTAHQNAASVHTAAINLANRELSGDLTGLVPSAQLANATEYPGNDRLALLFDRKWGRPKQAALGINATPVLVHNSSGQTPAIELQVPSTWLSEDMQFKAELFAQLLPISVQSTLLANLYLGNDLLSSIEYVLPVSPLEPSVTFKASVLGIAPLKSHGNLEFWILDAQNLTAHCVWDFSQIRYPYPVTATSIKLTVQIVSADPSAALNCLSGYIRALHPIP
jgi:hypothetical protein